jgi:hypothetical protein
VNGGPQFSDEERWEHYLLWRSQAALFLRWALDRDEPEKRAALWRFVEQASVRNVAEADFEAAFRVSYSEATKALLEYLPRAIAARSTVALRFPRVTAMPDVELREPTTAELARIKGDLERLEVGFLKETQPQIAAHYEAQARRTLRRAYDKGVRDPELLAVMGLCECDAGNDAVARPFLEAATKAGVVRPRAYYELARITYNALRAWDAEAKFSAKDTAELLQLLFAARTQSPPLPEVYLLIASVWRWSEVAPQRAQCRQGARGSGQCARCVRPGRCLAQRLFHHRSGVDEHLDLSPRHGFDQPAGERLQPLHDDVVIVLALGIERNPPLRAR